MINEKISRKFNSKILPEFEVTIVKVRNQFQYLIVLKHEEDIIPLKISRLYETRADAEYGAKVIEGHFRRLIEA